MNKKAIDKLVAEKRLRPLSTPPFDRVDRLLAVSSKDLKNVRKFLEIDESLAQARAEALCELAGGERKTPRAVALGLSR